MGAVSEALAAAAREAGAVIRTDAAVSGVIVRHGRARGVALDNGDEFEARVVASNADPKTTFLNLVATKELPEEFVDGIRKFRCEGTSMKINFALRGLPEFRCLPGAPGPQHRATMHICPSIEYVERAWDDAKYGAPSRRPLIELTIPTMYDASLAPEAHHVMGAFLQYAPYTLREGTWDELRAGCGERVLDLIEEYCPNIRDIVLDMQVLTPLDMEREFGLTEGNIFQGELTLQQMFFLRPAPAWARYRTPLAGLYQCGAGTHPGGGVMGASGRNAAAAILGTP
jgi:phytoene dehydrogenase-like protein